MNQLNTKVSGTFVLPLEIHNIPVSLFQNVPNNSAPTGLQDIFFQALDVFHVLVSLRLSRGSSLLL